MNRDEARSGRRLCRLELDDLRGGQAVITVLSTANLELPASAKGYTVHHKKMMQRRAVLVALAAAVAAWQPATRITSRATPLKMSEQLTDEEEAEIIANAQKIAKKKRSNLYNEDGVAYAPWMVRQVDEDAVAAARAMRGYEKRRERIALEEKQGTINILDAASSELTAWASRPRCFRRTRGMTWSTDDEEANRGFLVERKAVRQPVHKSWPPRHRRNA